MFKATVASLKSESMRFDGPLARVEAATLVFNHSSDTRVMTRLTMLNAYKVDSEGRRTEPQGTGEILRALNLKWVQGWRVFAIGTL
jgi:hypothetical protein